MLIELSTLATVTMPTWDDIDARLDQGEDIGAMEAFIHEHEPAAPHDEPWREMLTEAVAEMIGAVINAASNAE
jgi:hypothetical protein